MAIHFTPRQERVLQARNHNVLVSAAAGSGKTAVLVERIVRMITEGDHPLDIDRLLVVTFTRAAAAQMRERISQAISSRLVTDPENRHLQRQETLLHHAQITTIDSFCTFLLRNNFADIDLDPGFRQMDETESGLMAADVMKTFLESKYQEGSQEFLDCVDYFCPGSDDSDLEDLIHKLFMVSGSHPFQREWLLERKEDYQVADPADLNNKPWMNHLALRIREDLVRIRSLYDVMIGICEEPDGPYPYADFLQEEKESLFRPLTDAETAGERLDTSSMMAQCGACVSYSFGRIPSIRKTQEGIDPDKKELVKSLRDQAKKDISGIQKRYFAESLDTTVIRMQKANGPLGTLIDLTLEFIDAFELRKKEQNVIDFADLERNALRVLLTRDHEGNLVPTRAAEAYRRYFSEILIDEYQDSNEVQELLLKTIAGEEGGRHARFMVGDVKQSIYRFRNARPDIFVDKFDSYKPEDPETERIDLDQNFRSRREVLDSVNELFYKIMRREVGGVEYDETVSLKVGAAYPEPLTPGLYESELLLIDGKPAESGAGEGDAAAGADTSADNGAGSDSQTDAGDGEENPIAALSSRKKQALAIAQRIQQMIREGFPVKDDESGEPRPLRYSDIVILVRSSTSWNIPLREIFDRMGIPMYVDYKTGYFAAEEIRQVLAYLRIIDNPRQDLPLYGSLRGYFGGMSEDVITRIRVAGGDLSLYEALMAAASQDQDPELQEACDAFLDRLDVWREKALYLPIHKLLLELISETGYEDYVRALPSGEQRQANLYALVVKASAYEQTAYTGLFQFLRYIDAMQNFNVDYGEENVLDEKADVVRVMTIHKSKGLEFPVCFVAGLDGRFAFRGQDARGALIADADEGLGIDYMDLEYRARTTTLRKEAISDKIQIDAMGEELRVLYVAMTRAKEKLILTGYSRDAVKQLDGAAAQRDAYRKMAGPGEKDQLPVGTISRASSYLDLILQAGTLPCTVISTDDLSLADLEDQASLHVRRERLMESAEKGIEGSSLPELAGRLEKRFSYLYSHQELQGLFTKTTVSELKMAALEDRSGMEENGEGPAQLFPETHPDVIEPHFIRRARSEKEDTLVHFSGTQRGTAIHRGCELISFRKWKEPGAVTAEAFEAWVNEIVNKGEVPPEYAQVLKPAAFLPFLGSDIAARMAAADHRGWLRREQPFVLGLPADRLRKEFPGEETILIQGIIDAFFIEEDPDGQPDADGVRPRHIVVVDYKTDRVDSGQELVDRYQTQLDYYAEALERMLHLPVTEKILYSFRLQEAVSCK